MPLLGEKPSIEAAKSQDRRWNKPVNNERKRFSYILNISLSRYSETSSSDEKVMARVTKALVILARRVEENNLGQLRGLPYPNRNYQDLLKHKDVNFTIGLYESSDVGRIVETIQKTLLRNYEVPIEVTELDVNHEPVIDDALPKTLIIRVLPDIW